MFAGHLRELLDLLTPTCRGLDVRVDGFRMLNHPEAVRDLYPEDPTHRAEIDDPLEVYEPRLGYIRRLIESLLDVVDLEYGGRIVRVDGFRLKDPRQWLVSGGGAADILAHAATRCNLKCRFCYNDGGPPPFRPRPRDPDLEYRDVLTRIEHYVPDSGLGLFPAAGGPCEALAHPRAMEMLTELRSRTGETIRIPTNGSLLTPETIQALTGRRPVFLDVSLNSSSPARRRWLMNDPRPETAVESLAGLREAGLPYSVVIVPWPFPSIRIMLEDLEETVGFADRHEPAFIQISLPGYSRFFSDRPLFDHDRVWEGIKETVLALRERTACPLILRPGLYEEYQTPQAVNDPRPIGVIRNSPADRGGLRAGDRIVKLGGLAVQGRPQTRTLLTTLHRSELDRVPVVVRRQGRPLELEFDLRDYDYPYDPGTVGHLGIVFACAGLPTAWLENLRQVVTLHRAATVLLLTSRLVRPALEDMIRSHGFFSGLALHLRVPENGYFGGNVFMGDLLVVEDFVRAVRAFLDEGIGRPDLIAIPASPFHLSGWGRDLRGRVYKELDHRLGIPTALVPCDPIFD